MPEYGTAGCTWHDVVALHTQKKNRYLTEACGSVNFEKHTLVLGKQHERKSMETTANLMS